MRSDPPKPGTVFRYSYLWAREAVAGAEEGRKDRPAVVLTLVVRVGADRSDVVTLAVTHSPPARPTDAIEIPKPIKRQLGLDDDASYIVTVEANVFEWPGPDLRPIAGTTPPTFIYGRLPEALMKRVAAQYLKNAPSGTAIVRRTN